MGWRWVLLFDILKTFIIHVATFQWDRLDADLFWFKNWWSSYWSEIENRLDNLKGWAEGRISYLKGYAFGLFYQLGMDAARWVGDLRVSLTNWVNDLITWIHGRVNWLTDLAYRLKNEAIDWARGKADAVQTWARGYVDALIAWAVSVYQWLQPLRDLLGAWLPWVRGAIDWLKDYAWGHLQAFLANPIGYVMGWLLDPIVNLVNWWSAWGGSLRDFVVQDLPGLRNLLARGLSFLLTFVDRPGETILNLLYPVFLNWVENLIADNW